MAGDPAYILNFKQVTRSDPKPGDGARLEHEIFTLGSDRSFAVMLGSMMEESLKKRIQRDLRKDLNSQENKDIFGTSGVAGTFSTRATLAYSLGIIGKQTKSDLDLIRLIRNEFAHSRVPFDFNLPELAEVCRRLQSPDWIMSAPPVDYLRSASCDISSMDYPKTRYVTACHVISFMLGYPREGDGVIEDHELLP